MSAQSAIATFTRTVTVAAGVFAPGHLGELTQLAPFELVDDILERTRAVQRRVRDLPSRVGVYFLLALGLFLKASAAGTLKRCSRASWSSGGSGQRMLSPPGGISKSCGSTIATRCGSA